MQPDRQIDGPPLWQEFRPLAVWPPRVALITSSGIPECRYNKHQQELILATEEFFHKTSNHNYILTIIQKHCRFGDAWLEQRPFFSRLLSSFFDGASDCPAWIVMIPQRMTFQFRQDRRHVTGQLIGRRYAVAAGDRLADHRLPLRNVQLQGDGLNMLVRKDCPRRDTHLTYQIITRTLEMPPGKPMKMNTPEHWYYLSTPDGAEDETDARSAVVPALRQFFDAERHIQMATLIDFCKLSSNGQRVSTLTCNLEPSHFSPGSDGGRVIDFRATTGGLFEYYLRIGANSHDVLRQATTGNWYPL